MTVRGKTVIIAQARMSSTRLPGKVLMSLGDEPVIDHVVRRCLDVPEIDEFWVATTTDPSDDVLAAHLDSLGVLYYRGDLQDVLARYVATACLAEAATIVRVTCDCPFIDPGIIGDVIRRYDEAPIVDYCSNTLRRSFPIGMDTEVFSREVLDRAGREATSPLQREHVTPYIYQNPDKFTLRNLDAPEWAISPDLRLTIDEQFDLDLGRELVGRCGSNASLSDLLGEIQRDTQLRGFNAHVQHRHTEKPTL